MITMTVNEAVYAYKTLLKLCNQSFSSVTAFKLARLLRELEKEVLLFDAERVKIARKYGEKDEQGQVIIREDETIKIIEDKIKICDEEIQMLLNTKIEINASKIPIEVFNSSKLTFNQAMSLEKIVDF